MPDSTTEAKAKAKPESAKKVAVEFWVDKLYKVDEPFTRPAEMTDLCYNNLLSSGKVVDA
jgi:hypothetical protein